MDLETELSSLTCYFFLVSGFLGKPPTYNFPGVKLQVEENWIKPGKHKWSFKLSVHEDTKQSSMGHANLLLEWFSICSRGLGSPSPASPVAVPFFTPPLVGINGDIAA